MKMKTKLKPKTKIDNNNSSNNYYVRFYFKKQPDFNSRTMPTKLSAAFELVERIKYYYDISHIRRAEVPYKGEIIDHNNQVIFEVEMKQ